MERPFEKAHRSGSGSLSQRRARTHVSAKVAEIRSIMPLRALRLCERSGLRRYARAALVVQGQRRPILGHDQQDADLAVLVVRDTPRRSRLDQQAIQNS
jgi:hypothetical protein